MQSTDRGLSDKHRALIAKISSAFSEVPYPGDENIISTPDHIEVCDECRGLREVFVGKRWEETLDGEDWSDHLGHAMSFFSAAGWQYFLPAYLIQEIKRQSFHSLYFRPASKSELIEYQEGRAGRLTADQCAVVVEYLTLAKAESRGWWWGYEKSVEALKHWLQNYERAAARGPDAA